MGNGGLGIKSVFVLHCNFDKKFCTSVLVRDFWQFSSSKGGCISYVRREREIPCKEGVKRNTNVGSRVGIRRVIKGFQNGVITCAMRCAMLWCISTLTCINQYFIS